MLLQTGWLFLMRQVLQYGLNLQEFGAEMCGADVEEATHENALAMQSTVGSLLKDDELGDKMDKMERGTQQRNKRMRVFNPRSPSSGHGYNNNYYPRNGQNMDDHLDMADSGSDDGDFELLDDSDFYEYDSNSDEDLSDENGDLANTQPQLNMGQVVEMMTALTNTMSSLNQKIDAIESRVGDGSALLVMPPGENQWDANKGRR